MSSKLKLWTKAKISDILIMIETAEPGGELAKMRSEITALKSRVESLREGLEDIRSLRRIGHVSDVAVECDFYLNRDDEEI